MHIDPRLATVLALILVVAGAIIVITSGESVAVRVLTAIVTLDIAARRYSPARVHTLTQWPGSGRQHALADHRPRLQQRERGPRVGEGDDLVDQGPHAAHVEQLRELLQLVARTHRRAD